MSDSSIRLSETLSAMKGRAVVACLGVLSGLIAASLGGCSSSNAEAEEEPSEHARPAHRPHDLPEAVAQVRGRWAALATREGALQPVRRTELADILRWLPEIAGESQLNETGWRDVVTIATELAALFERRPPGSPDGGNDATRRTELLEALERLSAQAGPTIYGLRPAPDAPQPLSAPDDAVPALASPIPVPPAAPE